MLTDDDRAKFEAWAVGLGVNVKTLDDQAYPAGTYADSRTDAAWNGWQAATLASSSAAREDADRVCSDLTSMVMRLAYRLVKTETNQTRAAGNRELADQATDYLRRKGLTSPLRSEDAARSATKGDGTAP